ncbi:hypothetical protein QE152_g9645 [Popillia japonica]|uniref:Uncharacterized protein n=1 Tax=Popillia japonica TaxID=7064 RepID=A0AAW1LYA6_POPJA
MFVDRYLHASFQINASVNLYWRAIDDVLLVVLPVVLAVKDIGLGLGAVLVIVLVAVVAVVAGFVGVLLELSLEELIFVRVVLVLVSDLIGLGLGATGLFAVWVDFAVIVDVGLLAVKGDLSGALTSPFIKGFLSASFVVVVSVFGFGDGLGAASLVGAALRAVVLVILLGAGLVGEAAVVLGVVEVFADVGFVA